VFNSENPGEKTSVPNISAITNGCCCLWETITSSCPSWI